jgi:hypothetical protein
MTVDLSKNGYETFTALALKIDFWRGLVVKISASLMCLRQFSPCLIAFNMDGVAATGAIAQRAIAPKPPYLRILYLSSCCSKAQCKYFRFIHRTTSSTL